MENTFKLHNDPDAGMSYVKLTDGKIVSTETRGLVNLDLDKDGKVVGVEFFGLVSE